MSTPAPTGRAGDAPTDDAFSAPLAMAEMAIVAAAYHLVTSRGDGVAPSLGQLLARVREHHALCTAMAALDEDAPPAEAARAGEEATTDARATDR